MNLNIYSIIFRISFPLFAGCTQSSLVEMPLLTLKQSDYAYMINLQARLNLPQKKYSLNITCEEKRIAHFIPERNLIFSTGFLSRLQSEGEFAFILAHEIAHDILGHKARYNQGSIKAAELEADRFAAKLTLTAGYGKEEAKRAVIRTSEFNDNFSTGYPPIQERTGIIEGIYQQLASGNGYYNNRDFIEFQRSIMGYACSD